MFSCKVSIVEVLINLISPASRVSIPGSHLNDAWEVRESVNPPSYGSLHDHDIFTEWALKFLI